MLIGSSDFLSGPVREQPFSCAPYFHAILIAWKPHSSQHCPSQSWPSCWTSASPISGQQSTDQEHRSGLPQPQHYAVSSWACPQHQHVKNTSSHVFGFMPPQNGFFKSHQMTKVCHNHALPLYLLVFCKICTRIYCDFVPVICVLFVTCKLCDL